ncbi:uncharacterized protein LOC124457265 [Xenia sp. Carnegie-2017]|uniref:uncharacterized protein LOC124457265 n=1 Tax=Xenia sp. Carnegie-2017 TaxID=2897299 RepID=UPI001F042EF7|nr:uncharacterized protein LOC124457265 [Xenia sp. Carnegie-2017]
MRIFVLGRVVFSYLLLEISMGEKMVLKDATFEFWMKKSLIFDGSGQLFFKENGKAKTCADGRKTETWLLTETLKINQTLDDVKMFIEIDSKMANCDNEDGICFRDGFEIFTYNGNGEPVIPFPFNGNLEEKGKNSIYFNNNFDFMGNITGNETSKERFIKMFTIQVKKFNDITFGIKSTGACGTLFRMTIFYYVCQQKYKNSILLTRTLSPPNGTKVIYGNCSTNSEKLTKTSGLRAYCHSNGTWFLEKNASCLCRKGYEPTKEGCQGKRKFERTPMFSS